MESKKMNYNKLVYPNFKSDFLILLDGTFIKMDENHQFKNYLNLTYEIRIDDVKEKIQIGRAHV